MNELSEMILELCSEDDFGVWELYWNYQGSVGDGAVDDEHFTSIILGLVERGALCPFEHNQGTPLELDISRLRKEVETVRSGGDVTGMYWFGVPPGGKVARQSPDETVRVGL